MSLGVAGPQHEATVVQLPVMLRAERQPERRLSAGQEPACCRGVLATAAPHGYSRAAAGASIAVSISVSFMHEGR